MASKLKLAALGALAAGLALAPALGWAAGETVGTVAQRVNGNLDSVTDLLSGLAYLVGAVYGIKSLMAFRDRTENPHQTKLSKPLTYLVISASLLSLPVFIDMANGTLFGGSSTGSKAQPMDLG